MPSPRLRSLAATLVAALMATPMAPLVARADEGGAATVDDGLGEHHHVVGYRKGKSFKLEVVIVGHAPVSLPTARAFLSMQAAALTDGIDLYVYSGFRTNERQAELRQAYLDGYGNKAAKPGYSNHQGGIALDLMLDSPETFAWLEANAKRFGFARTVPKEPWHWEHVPPKAKRTKSKR